MQDMYRENIIDHYKNPRNFGSLQNADAVHKEFNILCGDEVELQLKFNSHAIADIKFLGKGCAISQASASILSEFVKGKNIGEIKNLQKEDVLELLGIKISAVRLKCALLSLYALKNAIAEFENGT